MTYSSLLASSARQGLVVASDLSEALRGLKGTPQKTVGSDLDPIEEISRILRNDPLDQLNIVAHGAADAADAQCIFWRRIEITHTCDIVGF